MPDRDNWTAAMVLKWVLVRDLSPVVAMTESYGATAFSEDGKSRTIVPEDLSTVMTGYCTDTKLPLGQESIRETVLRSQRAIAAKEKIYRALRRGDLEGRARRNGTGDVETSKIKPMAKPEIPILERTRPRGADQRRRGHSQSTSGFRRLP